MEWSEQEVEALKKLYPLYIKKEITQKQLLKVFPFRTISSLGHVAVGLGLTHNKGQINSKAYKEILKR